MPTRKLRNTPTLVHGVRYDSRKEAARAQELELLAKAGAITAWERQVRIPLCWPDGSPLIPYGAVRQSVYVADFLVTEPDGHREVEEVKGFQQPGHPITRLWRLKLALVERQLAAEGISLRLIE